MNPGNPRANPDFQPNSKQTWTSPVITHYFKGQNLQNTEKPALPTHGSEPYKVTEKRRLPTQRSEPYKITEKPRLPTHFKTNLDEPSDHTLFQRSEPYKLTESPKLPTQRSGPYKITKKPDFHPASKQI